MTRVRNSTRALVVLSGVPLTALLAVPALADVPNTAYDAGPGLTVSETLGIYIGIPLRPPRPAVPGRSAVDRRP